MAKAHVLDNFLVLFAGFRCLDSHERCIQKTAVSRDSSLDEAHWIDQRGSEFRKHIAHPQVLLRECI